MGCVCDESDYDGYAVRDVLKDVKLFLRMDLCRKAHV